MTKFMKMGDMVNDFDLKWGDIIEIKAISFYLKLYVDWTDETDANAQYTEKVEFLRQKGYKANHSKNTYEDYIVIQFKKEPSNG